VPKGVVFEPRPESRYTASKTEPKQGQTEGYVLHDTVEKKDVLFKPTKSEKEVERAQERGIQVGDYAARTKATEIAAEKLGIPTPKVELVQIGDKTGSVTDWVAGGYKSLWDLNDQNPILAKQVRESAEFKFFLDGIDALDYLTNNLDRGQNLGNYLVKLAPDGSVAHVLAIDHDLTYTATGPRARIEQRTRGLPEYYPADVAAKLRQLGADRAAFVKQIEPLVGPEAVPGVLHRLDEMIQDLEIKTRAGTADRPMPVGGPSGMGSPAKPGSAP